MNATQAQRCLILNRWNDEFGAYHQYIDHGFHQVAYIATPAGVAPLRADLAVQIEVVTDLTHIPSVLKAARRCAETLGGVDRIIALSEIDLQTAAELRSQFQTPGPLPNQVRRFRDKTLMKQLILSAGLRAPAFAKLDDAVDVEALIRNHGFPIVMKPKTGMSSIGCYVVGSSAEFEQLRAELPMGDYECEEFVSGPVLHVDGIFKQDDFAYVTTARYINTCYNFAQGKPLGSLTLNEGELARALRAFAKKCVMALGLSMSAFHLEVIGAADGLCFLEMGSRVGGADVPFVNRDVFGVDLIGEWLQLEFQGENAGPVTVRSEPAACGGWLRLPEPVGKRLVMRNSLVGKIACLYQEVLPSPGHVFDGKGGYEATLGGFRYRGPAENVVEAAMTETLRSYHYILEDADVLSPVAAQRTRTESNWNGIGLQSTFECAQHDVLNH